MIDVSSPFVDFVQNSKYVMFSGGLGTELPKIRYHLFRRYKLQSGAWSGAANLDRPELVEAAHRRYLDAGAVVLSTNTFRTHPSDLERYLRTRKAALSKWQYTNYANSLTRRHKIDLPGGDEEAQLKNLAEQLATLASARAVTACHKVAATAINRPAFTLLSYGPYGDTHSYNPGKGIFLEDLDTIHIHQATTLKQLGGDAMLPETIPTLLEAEAMKAAARTTGLPYIASFSLNAQGALHDGTSLREAVQAVRGENLLGIAINCTPIDVIRPSLEKLLRYYDGFVGAYANGLGHAHHDGKHWCYDERTESIEAFVKANVELAQLDPRVKFLGGCCGAGPLYISALRQALDGLYPEQRRYERQYRCRYVSNRIAIA